MVLSLNKTIVGRRLRECREQLGWSQEKVGVEIGLDESTARARISRYELGVHQPPEQITVSLAKVLKVPHAYLYCEDDRLAKIILMLWNSAPDIQDALLAILYSDSASLIAQSNA